MRCNARSQANKCDAPTYCRILGTMPFREKAMVAANLANRPDVPMWVDDHESEQQFQAAKRGEARSSKAAQRVTEGAKAMADYVADGQTVRAKTARLKELRLAKEA